MTADGGDRFLSTPRFDVVLRGYDRRQVDEHVARLQRVLARMRVDLDAVRSQPFPAVPPMPADGRPTPPGPGQTRPRPTPRPRFTSPPAAPDKIDDFSDRMQSILQTAEEEAEEIRNRARRSAKAEEEAVRAELAELVRQRDEVLGELTRLRGQLEGLLSSPTTRMPVTAPSGESDTPQPGPRPASGLPDDVAASTDRAVETTTVMRPHSEAPSQVGALFRPSSERSSARRAGEPKTTLGSFRPYPDPAATRDAGREAPGASEQDVEKTTVVKPVPPSSTTGSADPDRADAPGETAGSPAAEKPGSTAGEGHADVGETVAVSAVRPGQRGSGAASSGKNSTSGGSSRMSDAGAEGSGKAIDATSGSTSASTSETTSRGDRSTSGSRSG
ncbi:hypothetical protein ACFQE5_09810 [Pseudonocardia hispaniensis]|uniref:DivIVA domain-containing protein n=1 Tax=Pseudonocardia hispaniensis TaxID=904933 RepID=A0ABW1J1J5_9PSEU